MNLYNILIVDDEAFVVDWISNLLESQQDLSVYIYRAYSPKKALDLIERTRIDLLISDIQMPGYTGFDLSEQMNRLWPNSKTILLTAYSEFSYAQNAIQKGVVSYLLKTADDKEIISEIKKALTAIDQECSQLTFINNMEKDLKSFQTRLNAQIFSLWIRGYYSTKEELLENIKVLGFPSDSNRFVMIICRIDKSTGGLPALRQNLMKPFQIQRILEHNLAPCLEHFFLEVHNDLILGILQLLPSLKNGSQIIRDALDLVQSTCLNTLGTHISCLISPEGFASSIPGFWSLGKSLLSGFEQESDFIFSFGGEQTTSLLSDDRDRLLRFSYYNTMRKQLENGERKAFESHLNEVCAYLSRHADWHNTYSLQIYFSLLLVFINYINENKLNAKITLRADTGSFFRPWLSKSWGATQTMLHKMSDSLFSHQEMANKDSGKRIVETVQRYIDNHITEDVSLSDLAAATGYSTSYLSKYYSEATGSTFSEYMASRKLAKIAQLMTDTDMNIGAIAESMGFHSRTYFNNYIKRLTGMSPQQYRDSLTATHPEAKKE